METASPAIAWQHYLEKMSDDEWDQQNHKVIVADPDNPVETDDPWLARRERLLHEKLRLRKPE